MVEAKFEPRQIQKIDGRHYFMRDAQASMVRSMPRRERRTWLARNWRRVMPCDGTLEGVFVLRSGSPWLSKA